MAVSCIMSSIFIVATVIILCLFVCVDAYVQVNNFPVISERRNCFLSITSTFRGVNVFAHGHNMAEVVSSSSKLVHVVGIKMILR